MFAKLKWGFSPYFFMSDDDCWLEDCFLTVFVLITNEWKHSQVFFSNIIYSLCILLVTWPQHQHRLYTYYRSSLNILNTNLQKVVIHSFLKNRQQTAHMRRQEKYTNNSCGFKKEALLIAHLSPSVLDFCLLNQTATGVQELKPFDPQYTPYKHEVLN